MSNVLANRISVNYWGWNAVFWGYFAGMGMKCNVDTESTTLSFYFIRRIFVSFSYF